MLVYGGVMPKALHDVIGHELIVKVQDVNQEAILKTESSHATSYNNHNSIILS